MTLAIGNVTSGVSETDATSYVTGTAALTADRLNLLFVCARGAGSAAPTVTQTGVTWTLVRNQASGTITRMSVFSAKVSSNQSGTITIDFGSNTQSYCLWSVANFYDDVLGSAAVVQSASASSSGPDTSMTVTLAACVAGGDRGIEQLAAPGALAERRLEPGVQRLEGAAV